MPMCRAVSCAVGRGRLLWPVCSLGKTLLASAQLPFVLQGKACLLLQLCLDFLLLHSNPLWWKKAKALKNWCFWTVVLEKILESPLDCKEIQPVNPKGAHSCVFTGRTDAESTILWPPDAKNWRIRKVPDAGINWRQEEKGTTENEMVGWHHWLNGHEFE